jgi:hypothetical protein
MFIGNPSQEDTQTLLSTSILNAQCTKEVLKTIPRKQINPPPERSLVSSCRNIKGLNQFLLSYYPFMLDG